MSQEENNLKASSASRKRRRSSRQPRWIRWLGAGILAMLALHSLSYGSGFIANPVEGAREFGDSTPPSEAAEHLAGLVGVTLLLLALTAVVAATLMVGGRLGGAWLTLGLGIATLSIGAYWGFIGSAWDVGIYGTFGLLLTGTGAISVLYARQAQESEESR